MTDLQQLGTAFLAVVEGDRLKAYQDSGGIWTDGVGHTKDVKPGEVLTRETSLENLAADQAPLLALLEGRPLLEGLAYLSFGFNCGLGALNKVLTGQDSIANPV